MRSIKKKIVLWTAALNSPYGVTNFSKKKTLKKINQILEYAWTKGIRFFDTAPGYKSEIYLGKFFYSNNLSKKANVFTKLPTLRIYNKIKQNFL